VQPLVRRDVARFAAPAAFLVAITILIVLVHSGLSAGGGTAKTKTSAAPKHTTTRASKPKQKHHKSTTGTAATGSTASTATGTGPAQYYTVQSGDTFGSIASREGTTVTELEALNPGVSTTSLQVGQQIRVK
jgi:LysM repeat protein